MGYLRQAPAASFAPRLPVRPAGERRPGKQADMATAMVETEGHPLPVLSVFVGVLVTCTLP